LHARLIDAIVSARPGARPALQKESA